jgi:hypothetical protein
MNDESLPADSDQSLPVSADKAPEHNSGELEYVDDLPDVVYHYTSLDAMTKIIETGTLWCTAISYLNDFSEREIVRSAVRVQLEILQKGGALIDPALSLIDDPYTQAGSRLSSFANETFVASFSSNNDSLTHWRSYCPQHSGVSIGFKKEALKNARLNEKRIPGMLSEDIALGRVKYLDHEDWKTINGIIRLAIHYATKSTERASTTPDPYTLAHYFSMYIDRIAVGSKLNAFEAESEYRLVLFGLFGRENNLKFRTVRSTLIPYVEVFIPRTGSSVEVWDAVDSVTVGPTANMTLTARSVRAFLDIRGAHDVRLLTSGIPYRDW